jgi:hypothetical protein
MRTDRGLLLLALPLLAGCLPRCDGPEILAKVAKGDMRAVHEAGEFANTLIPSVRVPPSPPKLEEVYDALRPLLSADDPYLRLRAEESLRRLSTRSRSVYRDHYRGLFDPLLSDDDPQLRWRAAWALGRLYFSSEALRKAALDPDDRVAERAVWALGRARDEDAVPVLLQALDRAPLQGPAMRALKRVTGMRLETPEAYRAALIPKQPPPGGEQSPPGDETAPPGEKTAPPAEKTAPPAEKQSPPTEKTAPPAEKTAPPADSGASKPPPSDDGPGPGPEKLPGGAPGGR